MPHSRELNNKKRGSSDKHKKGSSRKDSGELKKGKTRNNSDNIVLNTLNFRRCWCP